MTTCPGFLLLANSNGTLYNSYTSLFNLHAVLLIPTFAQQYPSFRCANGKSVSYRRDAIGSRHASRYGRWTTPSGRVVAGMAVGTLPASAAYNHVLNGILCTLRTNVLHGLACSSQTSTTAVLIHTILSPMLACLPPADCIIQPSQDKLCIK